MAYKFNALTGTLDLVRSNTELDTRFVNVSGDTMTGNLVLGTHFLSLTDSNGVVWHFTVDTSGAIVTAPGEVVNIQTGQPIGLMGVTYAEDIT